MRTLLIVPLIVIPAVGFSLGATVVSLIDRNTIASLEQTNQGWEQVTHRLMVSDANLKAADIALAQEDMSLKVQADQLERDECPSRFVQ